MGRVRPGRLPPAELRRAGATAVQLYRFNATAQVIDIELEPVCVFRRSLTDHFGSVTTEIDIRPTGLPVRAQGTAAIVESGPESTHLLLTWRVQSGVPVIGDKVERLFADQVRNALKADHALTPQYLMAIAL